MKVSLAVLLILCAGAGVVGYTYVTNANKDIKAIGTCLVISDIEQKKDCYNTILTDRIATSNVPDGFKLLGRIYATDSAIRPECFGLTQRFVRAIYEHYPDPTSVQFSPETAWCNYGLFQKYPMVLLEATHNIDQAHQFCILAGNALRSTVPGAEEECYRGIGRGLGLIFASSSTPVDAAAHGVEACSEMATSTSYTRCISGLFNELGWLSIKQEDGYAVDETNTLYLCELQTDAAVQRACFSNFKWTSYSLTDQTPEGVKDALKTIYSHDAEASTMVAYTLGYETGRKSTQIGSYDAVIDACQMLPSPHDVDCIHGASVALAKNAWPTKQHQSIIAFCHAVLPKMSNVTVRDCLYSQAEQYIKGFYSPAAYTAACADIKRELGTSCTVL